MLVDTRNDCHLQLQEGTADAYLGHDTFIDGMMCHEDLQLRTFPEGTVSTYGIAFGKEHTYFVQLRERGAGEQLRVEGSLPSVAFEGGDVQMKLTCARWR